LTENVVVFSISYQDCLEKKTSQQIQKKIDMADFENSGLFRKKNITANPKKKN